MLYWQLPSPGFSGLKSGPGAFPSHKVVPSAGMQLASYIIFYILLFSRTFVLPQLNFTVLTNYMLFTLQNIPTFLIQKRGMKSGVNSVQSQTQQSKSPDNISQQVHYRWINMDDEMKFVGTHRPISKGWSSSLTISLPKTHLTGKRDHCNTGHRKNCGRRYQNHQKFSKSPLVLNTDRQPGKQLASWNKAWIQTEGNQDNLHHLIKSRKARSAVNSRKISNAIKHILHFPVPLK